MLGICLLLCSQQSWLVTGGHIAHVRKQLGEFGGTVQILPVSNAESLFRLRGRRGPVAVGFTALEVILQDCARTFEQLVFARNQEEAKARNLRAEVRAHQAEIAALRLLIQELSETGCPDNAPVLGDQKRSTKMCAACLGDGPGSSCTTCSGTGHVSDNLAGEAL